MSGIYTSEIGNRGGCFRDMHIHISITFLNFTTIFVFRPSYFVLDFPVVSLGSSACGTLNKASVNSVGNCLCS